MCDETNTLTPSERGEPFSIPTALFGLGQIVATPGVLEATTHAHRTACLARHIRGDWGTVCKDDAAENILALREGFRLLSVYPLDPARPCEGANRFWIITEADRSMTTFLLPSEY